MSENERMVREINKLGGYVYPVEVKLYNGTYNSPGMTLRDYMATAAMQAILSNPSLDLPPPDKLAQDAYNAADAMLEARK